MFIITRHTVAVDIEELQRFTVGVVAGLDKLYKAPPVQGRDGAGVGWGHQADGVLLVDVVRAEHSPTLPASLLVIEPHLQKQIISFRNIKQRKTIVHSVTPQHPENPEKNIFDLFLRICRQLNFYIGNYRTFRCCCNSKRKTLEIFAIQKIIDWKV